MIQSGWVKMHRSMLDWEWYSDINVCRLFTHMILKANHKDNKWRGILIKRGQTLTSLNTLESETGLSKSQIRTAVKKLISTREIAQQSHSQHTVFTVVNYDSYQGDDTQDGTPVASESHTNDTRVTSNKNDKNENNDKNDKKEGLLSSSNDDVKSVVDKMNAILNSKYKPSTKSHAQNISARLDEGHSIDDLIMVVKDRLVAWGNDPKMAQYLRPQTMFQAGKFNGYLMAAKTTPVAKQSVFNTQTQNYGDDQL